MRNSLSVSRGVDHSDPNSQHRVHKDQQRPTLYLGVSNFQRAISIVIPRSRSALSLSRTHAYLKATDQHSAIEWIEMRDKSKRGVVEIEVRKDSSGDMGGGENFGCRTKEIEESRRRSAGRITRALRIRPCHREGRGKSGKR